MRSMTGFGRGDATLAAGKVRVEIRSLNHRSVDVRLRVPDDLSRHAFALEKAARKRLARGRIDIHVYFEAVATQGIDRERARALYSDLRELSHEMGLSDDVPVWPLALVPEISTRAALEPDEGLKASLEALEAAIVALDEMRAIEGAALKRDVEERLAQGRAELRDIEKHAARSSDERQARLRDRIARLVQEHELTPDDRRLETELAFLAEKSDIAEELARLDSHFEQLALLFDATGPVGRKLEFLLQEVGREVNTIGSKSQDANVAQGVVELKTAIDRIRQQAANIE